MNHPFAFALTGTILLALMAPALASAAPPACLPCEPPQELNEPAPADDADTPEVAPEPAGPVDDVSSEPAPDADPADHDTLPVFETEPEPNAPSAVAPGPPLETPPADSPVNLDVAALVGANNTFAWRFYARLAGNTEGNFFFSPASIHSALTMTHAGARGQTAAQLYSTLALPPADRPRAGEPVEAEPWPLQRLNVGYQSLLGRLTSPADAPFTLDVANALWGQADYPWRDEFLAASQAHFGAGLQEVDFADAPEDARQTINTWVDAQTHQKIRELIPPGGVGPLTRLVLTNAVYFKGDWAEPFDPDRTREAPFHIAPDTVVQAQMMFRSGQFDFVQTQRVQIVRLPYAGDTLSMLVLLPLDRHGLAPIEEQLAEGRLEDASLVEALARMTATKLDVFLPKFTMTWEGSLADTLAAMGVTHAFDANRADFTGLSDQADDDQLHIDDVLHKAFVQVNEEGTEAAAVTGVTIVTTSLPPQFVADHPFVFLIRHDPTGEVLFVGRVVNPIAEAPADDH